MGYITILKTLVLTSTAGSSQLLQPISLSADGYVVLASAEVDPGNSLVLELWHVLEGADQLSVNSSVGGFNYWASGAILVAP